MQMYALAVRNTGRTAGEPEVLIEVASSKERGWVGHVFDLQDQVVAEWVGGEAFGEFLDPGMAEVTGGEDVIAVAEEGADDDLGSAGRVEDLVAREWCFRGRRWVRRGGSTWWGQWASTGRRRR